MARRTKVLLVVGLVVAALVGGGAWWYLKDDAAPRASLESAAERAADASDETSGDDDVDGEASDDSTPESADPGDPSGSWAVADGSFAGYRIDEVLTGGVNNTATSWTENVSGSLVIDGDSVTEVTIEVDLGSLSSTDGNGIRDGRVRGALDTATHPTATFALTEPIDLATVPAEGESTEVTATGDFTLKGVTRSVEVAIEAQLAGANLLVVGNAPVVLADHGIEAPSAGRVVSIEDAGEFEFELIFVRA